MALQKKTLGGFAALNTGQITDCYSKVSLRQTAGAWAAGFCAENRGTLERCAAQGQVTGKGRKSGFCLQQKRRLLQCLWLRGGQLEEADWSDWDTSLPEEEVLPQALEGWDLETVWHLHDAGSAPRLSLYEDTTPCPEGEAVVEIGDRQALLEFARQVNDGTAQPCTLYRLTADIDLEGRAWTPVGPDTNTPFEGCFDGNGHQIRNFVLHAGKHPFAGFFGCVGRGGMVRGLGVDCVLLGSGSSAAPLCASNEGEIVNCTAVFHGAPSRYTGGLAAQNSGKISRCAALGKIGRKAPLPWWLTALLLLLLCIPAPLYFSLAAQAAGQEIFAPVILDPNAVPIDPKAEVTPAPDEVTDTSASFIMNAEMYVSTDNYAGTIGLRCPTWSTRGFVATVRLTPEDQASIGYAGSGDYLTLYQSGLLAPGYGIEVITLGALPDGSRLPAGEYELSVLLEFYDTQTYEKSAVNTVVPLEVTVG